MNEPDTIVQAQMEALLRRVAREQESRSRRAREAAEEQARTIVARAWEEARARLRQAVKEERDGIERAVAERRAALETAARQREQTVLRSLIDHAWRDLPGILAATWQDRESRRDWCAAACAVARRTLNSGSPLVAEIDPTAPDDVAGHVATSLEAAGAPATETRQVEKLGAGLRIRSGLACVDATITGLLASRERVEAELLAELGQLLEQRGDHS